MTGGGSNSAYLVFTAILIDASAVQPLAGL